MVYAPPFAKIEFSLEISNNMKKIKGLSIVTQPNMGLRQLSIVGGQVSRQNILSYRYSIKYSQVHREIDCIHTHPICYLQPQARHLCFRATEQRHQQGVRKGCGVHRSSDSRHHCHRSQERVRQQVRCSFKGQAYGVREVLLRQHAHRREVGRRARTRSA